MSAVDVPLLLRKAGQRSRRDPGRHGDDWPGTLAGYRGAPARTLVNVPGALRRAGWGLADQVVSSGTNAALSILVARSVGEQEFGAFSVAFIVFSLTVGLSRAVCTSPLGMRFAGAADPEFARAVGSASGGALLLGLVAGAGSLLVGALVGGPAGAALMALALPLPALLVQDAWRFAFFAQSRPARATLNDAVWALGQLVGVSVLLARGVNAVGPFILAWGGAAAIAAVVGIRQTGVLPKPMTAIRWLRDQWKVTRFLLAEFGTLQAFAQVTMLLITAVASVSVVGSLRGAQVVLGPAALLAISLSTIAIPEFSRRRTQLLPREWMRGAVILSAVVTGLGAAWGLLFVLLPAAAGQALLGDTWAGTDTVLVASVVGQAGAAIAIGPATMLYAMNRAAVTMRIHTAQAPLFVVFGVGGVLLAGAPGAAWGMAAAFWVVVPAWWAGVRREARRTSWVAPGHKVP